VVTRTIVEISPLEGGLHLAGLVVESDVSVPCVAVGEVFVVSRVGVNELPREPGDTVVIAVFSLVIDISVHAISGQAELFIDDSLSVLSRLVDGIAKVGLEGTEAFVTVDTDNVDLLALEVGVLKRISPSGTSSGGDEDLVADERADDAGAVAMPRPVVPKVGHV